MPIETLAYAYDALNRPVSRNTDTFGYNDRSEVTSAIIAGGRNLYGYDEIGNSTNWMANRPTVMPEEPFLFGRER